MGFGNSKEIVKCYTCNWQTVATYRCSYHENPKTDIRNIDPETGRPNGDGKRAPCFAPKLISYWVGQGGNDIRYTACPICITPELEPYFTYFPNGWKEEVTGKYITQYEPINYVDPDIVIVEN